MIQRRTLTLTLASVAAFLVLIGLGTWQVERLHWKQGLIAERMAAISAPPVELPRTLDAARSLEFHRVRIKGHFLSELGITVHAIERRRGAAGYLLLMPMRLEDGAIVWVERGWVSPPVKTDAATWLARNPAGDASVDGLLRLAPEKKPAFIPANEHGEWFWIDLPALSRTASLPEALPFYVEAGPAPNTGGLLIGGQANTDLPNDHLQYAITWFSLAAALAVIYLILLRRERAATRNPPEPS